MAWLAGGVRWGCGRLAAHRQLVAAEQAKQELVSQLDRRSGRDTARTAVAPIAPERVQAINAAVQQLNLPWSELMDALESASIPQVAILEWSPHAESGKLKGVAEARTSDDMIAFARKLKAQTIFVSVELTGHQVNEQDRNKPLRFDFVVTWANRDRL